MPTVVPDAAIVRERALRSLDHLPPLSPMVGRLLSRLTFHDVAFEELAGLVSKDTLLCAQILQMVNSAGFARHHTITSIQQAMSLLGITRLRRIAVGAAFSNLFANNRMPPSWSRTRFNLHSAATAILVEAITAQLPVADNGGAFVAGMLHDLGRLLIAVGLPDEYELTAALASTQGRTLVDVERQILGTDHAELSGLALEKWCLAEPICRAVSFHEADDAPPDLWLAHVVGVASRFVNHLGISIEPATETRTDPPSLSIPGFEYPATPVLQRFEKDWKELAAFFR
jgi:HD-like signal output (HDOD) protein